MPIPMATPTLRHFAPQCKVIAKTWRGEVHDLTEWLHSWDTTRAIAQAAGTFTLNLDAGGALGDTWGDRIRPMDYLEIQAGYHGQLQTVWRGFTDTAYATVSLGQSGGPSEPLAVVQGRDYGKLAATTMQILYLWQLGAMRDHRALIAAGFPDFALQVNYGIQTVRPYTVPAFFAQLDRHIAAPYLQKLSARFPDGGVLPFTYQVTFPDWIRVQFAQAPSYTGALFNLWSYYAAAPYAECFITDTPAAPTVVARIPPYKTLRGGIIAPGQDPFLDTLTVDAAEVYQATLGRSDQDMATFFFTYGDMGNVTAQTEGQFAGQPHDPIYNSTMAELWGIQPLATASPLVNVFDGSGKRKVYVENYRTVAERLNDWLAQAMTPNAAFYAGTLQIQGNPDAIIGRYLTIPQWSFHGYIAGVQHQFTAIGGPNPQWTTTLSVVRGVYGRA